MSIGQRRAEHNSCKAEDELSEARKPYNLARYALAISTGTHDASFIEHTTQQAFSAIVQADEVGTLEPQLSTELSDELRTFVTEGYYPIGLTTQLMLSKVVGEGFRSVVQPIG